ncbi:MAG: flagellar basal body rod protein FlgB [Arcobacteraceae bacterium]|jgi:flagellar basal-body rod protein FlgB|nr:flagellar basal body rod protein FlgB [Arcobacteraceae bacterium]
MHASDVSNFLYQKLNYTSERQKVIAGNIANINTPDYKTKDLSFDDHLKKTKSDGLQLTTTHKNHIPFSQQDTSTSPSMKLYEVADLEEQNDGNNVSLDKQISEMSKNAVMNDAIGNSIKRDSRWFKMMVDAAGKN